MMNGSLVLQRQTCGGDASYLTIGHLGKQNPLADLSPIVQLFFTPVLLLHDIPLSLFLCLGVTTAHMHSWPSYPSSLFVRDES